MDRITRDNFFGQMARTLDLRSTVESAEEAKRRVRATRSPRRSEGGAHSPRRTMPATPGSPPVRPFTAGGTIRSPASAQPPSPASSLRSPAAAAALEQFQALEQARHETAARVDALEDSMQKLTALFTASLSGDASAPQFYSVTWGPGHIGLVLASDDLGNVEVAELRDDPETKRPLLAKASGKIAVGDYVIAINNRVLFRYGPATLEQVAAEFKSSPRPVTVLFQRNPHALGRSFLG